MQPGLTSRTPSSSCVSATCRCRAGRRVLLHLDGADYFADVWLNGKYIGKHDIGPDGWKVPFWLDVTREIRFGGENLLAVRVKDTEKAGGIWKPVTVDILK